MTASNMSAMPVAVIVRWRRSATAQDETPPNCATISTMDWTVIAVGLLTATAALGGQLVPVWAERRRETRAKEARHWEARRDAYLQLLKRIRQLNAVASGTRLRATPHDDKELVRLVVAAAVTAELFAPPSVWEDMRPLVLAVLARSDASLAGVDPVYMGWVAGQLGETDARTQPAWEEHWHRFLRAARRDLGLPTVSE